MAIWVRFPRRSSMSWKALPVSGTKKAGRTSLSGDDGVGIVGLEHPVPEVLAQEDPHDVVAVLPVEGDAAAAGLAEGLGGGLGRHGRGERDDRGCRPHDLRDVACG